MAKDEVDCSAEERQSPGSTQETDKLTDSREEGYPISPDASVEMAITKFSVIRLQELNLIESTDPEGSVSSISSTSVLERTVFLQDVCQILFNLLCNCSSYNSIFNMFISPLPNLISLCH